VASALPVVDEGLCDRCGLCVDACPCHAIEMTEKGLVFHCSDECVKASTCSPDCGLVCEEVCPTGAITCSFEIVVQDNGLVHENRDQSGERE
jgi:formate hydrogenlyase subunit 6/NADH:ubiquinone oxidoreductase subunit I